MRFFDRKLFTSLSEALAAPTACCRLHLAVNDEEMHGWGPKFLRFLCLQELHLHGQPALYDHSTYSLPEELSQVRTLREVELLNLPLAFPAWVRFLPKLDTLTLRGTDAVCLPEWIDELKALRTLRVENCALRVLPNALRGMHHLRDLSLCDTQLPHLEAVQFPQHLRSLNLGGARRYPPAELEHLRQELPQTRIFPDPVTV